MVLMYRTHREYIQIMKCSIYKDGCMYTVRRRNCVCVCVCVFSTCVLVLQVLYVHFEQVEIPWQPRPLLPHPLLLLS